MAHTNSSIFIFIGAKITVREVNTKCKRSIDSPLEIRRVSFSNGQKYAGEVHFVHANTETNALAVLGFFIQTRHKVSNDSTETPRRRRRRDVTEQEWGKYFAAASGLANTANESIVDLNLAALIGDRLANFWRYAGSLTVPPCTEGVTWTVFTEPIELDDSVFESFRDDIFSLTFREPQPLNGRTVYRNFPVDSFASTAEDNCCATITSRSRSNMKSISFSSVFLLLLLARLFAF